MAVQGDPSALIFFRAAVQAETAVPGFTDVSELLFS